MFCGLLIFYGCRTRKYIESTYSINAKHKIYVCNLKHLKTSKPHRTANMKELPKTTHDKLNEVNRKCWGEPANFKEMSNTRHQQMSSTIRPQLCIFIRSISIIIIFQFSVTYARWKRRRFLRVFLNFDFNFLVFIEFQLSSF